MLLHRKESLGDFGVQNLGPTLVGVFSTMLGSSFGLLSLSFLTGIIHAVDEGQMDKQIVTGQDSAKVPSPFLAEATSGLTRIWSPWQRIPWKNYPTLL